MPTYSLLNPNVESHFKTLPYSNMADSIPLYGFTVIYLANPFLLDT